MIYFRIVRDFLLIAFVLAIVGAAFIPTAHAGGLYSELGMGVKDFNTTSFILRSDCEQVVVISPSWPVNPRGPHPYSCGGDQPVFIGTPLGWDFGNGWSVSWKHVSQWFDGNGEIHMDALTISKRFNWGKHGH